MTTVQPPSPPATLRQPSDRQALVRWVRDTPGLQEPDWLEWKRGYDLTRKAGRATSAKHLIGLANRDPGAAARHLDGVGALLLGVEPGDCPGVEEHDSADLETWLRPFVGEKVVFDIHYVSLDGSRVLLLAVEPPRYGDDVHSLRRGSEDSYTGKTMREGTVFVRRIGKTEPASATDIDRLTERARQAGLSLELDLAVLAPVKTLDPFLLREELRDEYLADRRKKLLSGLPRPATGALLSIRVPDLSENRTEERFVADVDRFMADAASRWEMFVAIQEMKREPSVLELELANETDDNFEDVVLEVTLPLPRARVHLSASGAEEALRPPEEPAKWGSGRIASIPIKAASAAASGAELVARGESETLIRFPPMRARPRTRHRLPAVLLVLAPDMAGETLEAGWRATSSSTRGQIADVAEIEVVVGDQASQPDDEQAA